MQNFIPRKGRNPASSRFDRAEASRLSIREQLKAEEAADPEAFAARNAKSNADAQRYARMARGERG